MSNELNLTVNQVLENYGPIIAASTEETPCGNNWVVAWNCDTDYFLFSQIDGLLYLVDHQRISYAFNTFDVAFEFANDWVSRVIAEEMAAIV